MYYLLDDDPQFVYYLKMKNATKRTVNREIIDMWVDKNGPDGMSRLALSSKVSGSTIQNARYQLRAPKKYSTLLRLSETLGVTIEAVFPSVSIKKTS